MYTENTDSLAHACMVLIGYLLYGSVCVSALSSSGMKVILVRQRQLVRFFFVV